MSAAVSEMNPIRDGMERKPCCICVARVRIREGRSETRQKAVWSGLSLYRERDGRNIVFEYVVRISLIVPSEVL